MSLPKYVKFDQLLMNVVFRVEKLDARVSVRDATASINNKNFVSLVGCNGKYVDIVKDDVNITVLFESEDTLVVQDVEESARKIVRYLTS